MLPLVSAQAKWIEKPSPDFPLGIYYSGVQGSVVVSLTMDKSGRVVGSQIVRSSGHSILDQLARDASLKWRLSPDSLLATDMTVGRLELIKFKQTDTYANKSLLLGSTPYWAQIFP
jgi:TonB family protein